MNAHANYVSAESEDIANALIDERAKEIDANTGRVVELFMEEAMSLTRDHRGNGHNELIELSVAVMNAWPVMEKAMAGLPVTLSEASLFPALYRQLKPLFDSRAVLVREAAEDELAREAADLAGDYVPD